LYLQLVEVEQAFKELKNDLSIRPIYHQLETRIEAHIFIAFLAYCLLVTLKQRLKTLAPGLTARVVLEKLAAMQMIDVELPTTDDRVVVLSRYTEPEKDQLLLLRQLKLQLPAQPPPKITARNSPENHCPEQPRSRGERSSPVVPTFEAASQGFQQLGVAQPPQLVKSGYDSPTRPSRVQRRAA